VQAGPGQAPWSRLSGRLGMRTNDPDQLEGGSGLDICRQAAWAPCVTWVLDERGVVGDNILDLGVSPWLGARLAQCSKVIDAYLNALVSCQFGVDLDEIEALLTAPRGDLT
jgi:hypothetical protein